MKKILSVLVACLMCILCAFCFTACEFSVYKHSGKENVNEQPADKEEDKENNDEKEKTVITANTDFDAIESDIVEKEVFINACMFLFRNCDPYTATNVNCTFDVPAGTPPWWRRTRARRIPVRRSGAPRRWSTTSCWTSPKRARIRRTSGSGRSMRAESRRRP